MKQKIIMEPDILGEKLNLPNKTVDCALSFRDQTLGNIAFDGRKPSVISAACVYLAALESDYPLTMRELHESCGVSEPSLKRMVEYISDILEINIPEKHVRVTRNGIKHFTLYSTSSTKRVIKRQRTIEGYLY